MTMHHPHYRWQTAAIQLEAAEWRDLLDLVKRHEPVPESEDEPTLASRIEDQMQDASVELTVERWLQVLDCLTWDKPLLVSLIEAKVSESLGIDLRVPKPDGPDKQSPPKRGA